MNAPFKVGLIRASLPSYFPERHQIWDRAQAALESLCAQLDTQLYLAPDIPQDAHATSKALEACMAEQVDFVLVLHGGFTMGDVARTVAASSFRAGFWSVPEPVRSGDIQLNNFVSLNMSMSIARTVRDLKRRPIQWYHGAPESAALVERLRVTFRALQAAKTLKQARVGVIGGVAPTFYNIASSSNALQARLGVETCHHAIDELTSRMAAIDNNRAESELTLMREAAPVHEVNAAQMELTARCALALRDIAKTENYAALAVSDWPALQQDPGMHPGAAFTWLEEKDTLPVASEGDVLGAITQLVAKSLSGRVGYLLDMTEPDLATGQLLMWHGGGGPLYLADASEARWINHPMIGRDTEGGPRHGAICDLVFRAGPVSVVRIARDAGALFTMTARVVKREPNGFLGSRGWLKDFVIDGAKASLEDVVATVMSHGLEHHFILVPQNICAELTEFGAWCDMEPLTCRPLRDHLDARDFS